MIIKLAVKYAVGTVYHTEYTTSMWTITFDGTAEGFLDAFIQAEKEASRRFAISRQGIVTRDESGSYYLNQELVSVKDFTVLYKEEVE